MQCLIVGSGPAALLAADLLSARGIIPQIFEKRSGPGWKLLVAGSSGLNVSHGGDAAELASFYPQRQSEIAACLSLYSRDEWLAHLTGLGEEVFLGTSRRYFIRNKKASALLSAWTTRLEGRGVQFHFGEELKNFASSAPGVELEFQSGKKIAADAALFALGGASWEDAEPRWAAVMRAKALSVPEFSPANAGYSFRAPPGFFARAEGKPVKGLTLTTALGAKTGELMITRYGLEGTPIYTLGCPGPAHLDLKPDIPAEKLSARVRQGTKAQMLRSLKVSAGAELLLEEFAPPSAWDSPANLARAAKNLPLELLAPRPLSESISSRGGLSWDELTPGLELKKFPGIFCAGEMVDWDAPTGGFLLQASASMGAVAAQSILARA